MTVPALAYLRLKLLMLVWTWIPCLECSKKLLSRDSHRVSHPVGDSSGYGFPTLIHVWIVPAGMLEWFTTTSSKAETIQTWMSVGNPYPLGSPTGRDRTVAVPRQNSHTMWQHSRWYILGIANLASKLPLVMKMQFPLRMCSSIA